MNLSELIDNQIQATSDWRGEILKKLREIIHSADSEIQEDWKWSTAVFVKNGLVCAISAFKNHVKINFFKGAKLKDSHNLINAGLESKDHRSIDFHEGDVIREQELTDLIVEAIKLNL